MGLSAPDREATMKLEIMAIGDEILLGQVDNTNAGWMARAVLREGIQTHRMTVIPDDRDVILEAFQKAYHRSDVVLITGGLGPTHDDLTKELIAKFFNLPLVFRTDLLDQVKEAYRRQQLSFVDTSRNQADFPEGATPLRNVHGAAPGIWVEKAGRVFVAMPGVPVEMQGMMTRDVLPRLKKIRRGDILLTRTLHVVGLLEAELYEKLDNRDEILEHAKLAFLPGAGIVRLRLTVETDSMERAEIRLDKAEKLIREKVGAWIVGKGDDFTLAAGIGKLLKQRRLRLTLAESCTGGWLAKQCVDVAGSSDWFERGFVTYSNEAKHEQLGVPYGLIDKHGAVSAEVAEAMAEGALKRSRAQVALSVTGIAGPTGGTDEKPVGLVYIGYADRETTTSEQYQFDGARMTNRKRSTMAAFQLLIQQLLQAEA